MYLLAKLGGHSSYGNGDINSYISSYMDALEKAELSTSVRHIERFLNQEYQFTVPKSWMRLSEKQAEGEIEKQAVAKRYAFHANANCLGPLALP